MIANGPTIHQKQKDSDAVGQRTAYSKDKIPYRIVCCKRHRKQSRNPQHVILKFTTFTSTRKFLSTYVTIIIPRIKTKFYIICLPASTC